jgi:hypothetical protein
VVGYLLTGAPGRLGGEAIGRMRAGVLAETTTTFASSYAQTIGRRDVLAPGSPRRLRAPRTGTKYLLDPTLDRST